MHTSATPAASAVPAATKRRERHLCRGQKENRRHRGSHGQQHTYHQQLAHLKIGHAEKLRAVSGILHIAEGKEAAEQIVHDGMGHGQNAIEDGQNRHKDSRGQTGQQRRHRREDQRPAQRKQQGHRVKSALAADIAVHPSQCQIDAHQRQEKQGVGSQVQPLRKSAVRGSVFFHF